MIKEAVIKIIGEQEIDGSTDTIEFTTDGKFGIKDGEYFLSYEEGKLFESDAEIKTQIILKKDDSVILQRSGALKSRIVIKNGVRNTCFYSTMHGELVIGVYGEKVSHSLTENGGLIELSYTLDSDLSLMSKNKVNITVKEV